MEGGGIGWGGVEGWGENADNCNWITIEKLRKKEFNVLFLLWMGQFLIYLLAVALWCMGTELNITMV